MLLHVVEIVRDLFHQIQQVMLECVLDTHRILEVSSYCLANSETFDKILETLHELQMS